MGLWKHKGVAVAASFFSVVAGLDQPEGLVAVLDYVIIKSPGGTWLMWQDFCCCCVSLPKEPPAPKLCYLLHL